MISIILGLWLVAADNPDAFLRNNEVPVSGIPTVRVEIPFYDGPAEGETNLSVQEQVSLKLFPSAEEAALKCESSYESLLARIREQLKGIIVMKMEKCKLSGPHQALRKSENKQLPYTFYRYEAYVSFLLAPTRIEPDGLEVDNFN